MNKHNLLFLCASHGVAAAAAVTATAPAPAEASAAMVYTSGHTMLSSACSGRSNDTQKRIKKKSDSKRDEGKRNGKYHFKQMHIILVRVRFLLLLLFAFRWNLNINFARQATCKRERLLARALVRQSSDTNDRRYTRHEIFDGEARKKKRFWAGNAVIAHTATTN